MAASGGGGGGSTATDIWGYSIDGKEAQDRLKASEDNSELASIKT